MELGREVRELISKALAIGERIAVANEELIRLATEERSISDQPGPAFCPHCQTLNPHVSTQAAAGPMADYIMVASCDGCGETIYGVPDGWQIAATVKDARNLRLAGRSNGIAS